MNVGLLIFKEMAHRKLNALLSLLGVALAVALFIFFFTAAKASERETTRLMRDLGYNLRIVSKQSDMSRFWDQGFSEHTLPQSAVEQLAAHEGLSYNHLLAVLARKIEWQGHSVRIEGIAAEIAPPGKKKSPMIFSIEPGEIYVGAEAARSLGIDEGATVLLGDREFRVARRLSATGTEDDMTVYAELGDVQRLFNLEGRINEIKALECLCLDPTIDSEARLREQLARVLPDARVIQIRNIAEARERQRRMIDSLFARMVPFILIVAAGWVGILAFLNVRDRRREIGILRALGKRSSTIAVLFLGKAALIGLAAGLIGFTAGTVLCMQYGPQIFIVTANSLAPAYDLLGFSLIAAAVFTALASLIPALLAVTQDPARALREDRL